jgi:hypothetical protein
MRPPDDLDVSDRGLTAAVAANHGAHPDIRKMKVCHA